MYIDDKELQRLQNNNNNKRKSAAESIAMAEIASSVYGRNDDTHNLLETKMFPQRRTSTTLLRALSPERVHRYLTTYHPLSSPLLIRKGWGMNF
ncbi:uncharacterized protein CLUP02_10530 [Colletotrichum lupini]|uniref:Uncharacterized protein n=1 Tax=Colletotrichum lupini TaxID=145971 RepID=A0A9Q8SWS5_9PEZI|nr:uncharacterized protein CLUP02_10530 [Colletotrichum lupini]UQC85034.1 hypothetical protein CLUP02_10530 [Colletotrichum lupini]